MKKRSKPNPSIMPTMQCRFTNKMLRGIDRLIRAGVYSTRSEAVRDAVRRLTLKR